MEDVVGNELEIRKKCNANPFEMHSNTFGKRPDAFASPKAAAKILGLTAPKFKRHQSRKKQKAAVTTKVLMMGEYVRSASRMFTTCSRHVPPLSSVGGPWRVLSCL